MLWPPPVGILNPGTSRRRQQFSSASPHRRCAGGRQPSNQLQDGGTKTRRLLGKINKRLHGTSFHDAAGILEV